MNNKFADEVKKVIIEKQGLLEKELKQLRTTPPKEIVSGSEDERTEVRTWNEEQDRKRQETESILRVIETVLKQIEAGIFGICTICKKEIPEEEIWKRMAMGFYRTDRCSSCQLKINHQKK